MVFSKLGARFKYLRFDVEVPSRVKRLTRRCRVLTCRVKTSMFVLKVWLVGLARKALVSRIS